MDCLAWQFRTAAHHSHTGSGWPQRHPRIRKAGSADGQSAAQHSLHHLGGHAATGFSVICPSRLSGQVPCDTEHNCAIALSFAFRMLCKGLAVRSRLVAGIPFAKSTGSLSRFRNTDHTSNMSVQVTDGLHANGSVDERSAHRKIRSPFGREFECWGSLISEKR